MAIAARPSVRVETTEAAVGRAALVGGLLGFVSVSIAVTVMAVMTSEVDVVPALALGVFVGSWGGLGFGAMLAASVAGNRDM